MPERRNLKSKNPKERLRCIWGTERKPVCLNVNDEEWRGRLDPVHV